MQINETVQSQADDLQHKVQRRRYLENRPQQTLKENLFCTRCKKRIPWQELKVGLFTKVLIIDGIVYCADCAKIVATGLQALMIKMNSTERADYYKDIREKIEGEQSRERLRNAFGNNLIAEIDYDDVKTMKDIYRNRDGSMETQPLRVKIRNAIKKAWMKRSEKRIAVGGK
jgi:hypothetical protein